MPTIALCSSFSIACSSSPPARCSSILLLGPSAWPASPGARARPRRPPGGSRPAVARRPARPAQSTCPACGGLLGQRVDPTDALGLAVVARVPLDDALRDDLLDAALDLRQRSRRACGTGWCASCGAACRRRRSGRRHRTEACDPSVPSRPAGPGRRLHGGGRCPGPARPGTCSPRVEHFGSRTPIQSGGSPCDAGRRDRLRNPKRLATAEDHGLERLHEQHVVGRRHERRVADDTQVEAGVLDVGAICAAGSPLPRDLAVVTAGPLKRCYAVVTCVVSGSRPIHDLSVGKQGS